MSNHLFFEGDVNELNALTHQFSESKKKILLWDVDCKHTKLPSFIRLATSRLRNELHIYYGSNIKNIEKKIREIYISVIIKVERKYKEGYLMRFTDYQTGEFIYDRFVSKGLDEGRNV